MSALQPLGLGERVSAGPARAGGMRRRSPQEPRDRDAERFGQGGEHGCGGVSAASLYGSNVPRGEIRSFRQFFLREGRSNAQPVHVGPDRF